VTRGQAFSTDRACGLNGGAICTQGMLELTYVDVYSNAANGNRSQGGAVFAAGYFFSAINSNFYNNTATISGGLAIFSQGEMPVQFILSRSAVYENIASFGSSGLGVDSNSTVAINVVATTFSQNRVFDGVGAIGVTASAGSTFSITGSTIVNTNYPTRPLITFSGGRLELTDTIVAGSPTATVESVRDRDNGGVFFTGGNVIAVVENLSNPPADTDQLGSLDIPLDPMLGELQNNGGPTWTHLPLFGSPAIDRGVYEALHIDQRGIGRWNDGDGDGLHRPDAGAAEAPPTIVIEPGMD
ncbi:MAG: choice-of-anchor Q domain-containing protein, partial [Myxococcota bacterium]